jgi:predicted O-linked N-acetylglucosamine transferase (SPINDLY family)
MPGHAAHQSLQAAVAQYQAGSPRAAEKLCRQVLSRDPNNVDALNLLGGCLYHTGNLNEAIKIYQRIVALKPNLPEAHNNLGGCLQRNGRVADAISAYKTAIRLKPDFNEAKSNLAAAYFEWGKTLLAGQQTAEALEAFQQAAALKPDFIEALGKVGQCLQSLENLDGAIATFQAIIRLKPDSPEAFNNLGVALQGKRQLGEAIACFRQAVRLKPDLAEAHSNLGAALHDVGRLDEAIAPCRQAIRLAPDSARAHNNLGNALKDMGQLDEAISGFRQAIRIEPGFAEAHSNLIFTLQYHPGYDSGMIHEELGRWNRQHAEPLKKFIQPHHNNRDPERCLRIGYVSADFFDHASAYFLLPLFRHHDPRQVEMFCYSHRTYSDKVTQEMKDHVQHWRSTMGLTDAKVAAQIRADQIDILVDLKVHTAENYLVIFAHKPAPVQATWLGYPGTTGMDAIDYRLTDPYLDPPGLDDAYYSERSIRLPDTFWCYDPLTNEPAVNAPPCLETGFVTLGCLNNFCKVSDAVLTLWAQVLNAISGSHLLLMAPEGSSRRRVLDRLGREGIDPERVEFVGKQSHLAYLQTYHRIDLALDTLPYNGHTTSLDSFWMGVPVVTLVGQRVVGRAGLSQLSNLGLAELAARTPQQYVQIAADLAKDMPRLAELRRTLRARMEASPLMDAPRFARNVEAAYRQMWRNWCEQGGVRPSANRPLQSGI